MSKCVRSHLYTPEALENLAELGVSEAVLARIDKQVARLAERKISGIRILFSGPRELYQYTVGPYKLNYIFDDHQLTVISVMT
jgi:hypothetical protein